MRRIVVTGLIVFSALALSMVGGAADQRTRGVGAAITRTPAQVEVTNFPAVQGVSGTVNVGNLPAVQNVGGSVAVSNLPLDAEGNLRTAATGTPRSLRFLGFTNAMLTGNAGALVLNRACQNEFPGSRECSSQEVVEGIDPALASGLGWTRPTTALPIFFPSTADLLYVDPVSGLAVRNIDLGCTAGGGRGLTIKEAGW